MVIFQFAMLVITGGYPMFNGKTHYKLPFSSRIQPHLQPHRGATKCCCSPKRRASTSSATHQARLKSCLNKKRWGSAGKSPRVLDPKKWWWLVGGIPTPLKKCESHLGWWKSQYMGKYKMFQTTNQFQSMFPCFCFFSSASSMIITMIMM